MMCLSHTAGYAIHALGVLASRRGGICLIREVAEESGIPKPYLAKIFNQLSREGLVAAKRGYRGGIYLTRSPGKISLLEVVEAIDGKTFIADCMLGLKDCSMPCLCPTHDVWMRIKDQIRKSLRQTTLAHILEGIQDQGELAGARNGNAKASGRRRFEGCMECGCSSVAK